MKSVKWLAFSCPHCPLQDQKAVDFVKQQIEDFKPDTVVLLGDLHEADSASKWPSEYDWTLEDEYESANGFLEEIRLASNNAQCVFLPGNHDDNINAIGRLPSKVRSLLDYKDHESELFSGNWLCPTSYVFDRRKGVYKIGQVSFYHGWQSNKSSDENQSIILGQPYGLGVSGHTHVPVRVSQASKGSVRLPYWYSNTGTVRNIDDVPYMQRKDRSNWGQGVVVGESQILKSPRLYRAWDAELRLFRLYGD